MSDVRPFFSGLAISVGVGLIFFAGGCALLHDLMGSKQGNDTLKFLCVVGGLLVAAGLYFQYKAAWKEFPAFRKTVSGLFFVVAALNAVAVVSWKPQSPITLWASVGAAIVTAGFWLWTFRGQNEKPGAKPGDRKNGAPPPTSPP